MRLADAKTRLCWKAVRDNGRPAEVIEEALDIKIAGRLHHFEVHSCVECPRILGCTEARWGILPGGQQLTKTFHVRENVIDATTPHTVIVIR